MCPVCNKPIKIPKTYGECLPTTHNTCVRSYVNEKIIATNLKKYGGNPMHNPEIRKKWEAVITSEEVKTKKQKYYENKKQKLTEYKKYLLERKQKTLQRLATGRTHFKHDNYPDFVFEKLNDVGWLKKMLKQKTLAQVGNLLGVSPRMVQEWAYKHNLNIPRKYASINEREIADFIESLGFEVLTNVCSVISPFELDIYIPSVKIAVEHNGKYWHTEAQGKDWSYHITKLKLCEEKQIRLIQIIDEEWENKKEIVQSRIRSILKQNSTIPARNCHVDIISAKAAKQFVEQTHIQGFVGASIWLGLHYQDELVAVMGLRKSRFSKKYQWEILRFSNKLNTNVVGGASKLFSFFVKNYSPQSVISYCDLRWNSGNMYQKLGFNFSHNSQPSYVYVKGDVIFSRTQCQKNKLASLLPEYDPSLTEHQNMLNAGFARMWDCGNKVFVWTRTKTT